MSKGRTTSELDVSPPSSDNRVGGLSHQFYGDPALAQAFSSYQPARTADSGGEHLAFSSPYPVARVGGAGAGKDMPLLNDTISQEIGRAGQLTFSTPADNQSSPPDYRLKVGDDGQLHLEKVGDGDPLDDGKLNIEIDPKDKSLQEAIKQADQNLKEYIREMMTLWRQNHPNEPHPDWWDAVLNSQPNIPGNAQPVQAERAPRPQQRTQAQPEAMPQSSNGGFSPGGGFAGHGGFDKGGYFHGNGGNSDGSVWTGGQDAKGAPVGPGEQAKAKDIYDYFVDKGFTPAQASGILGNIQTESSFKTNAYNAGEGAIGICQWEGGRRTALENFAAEQGKPVTDIHVQLDFIMYEFTHSESSAYAAVKNAQTPEAAAQAFQSKYERSASLGDRAANAAQWYNRLA